jgi:hypothetical protein
MPTRRRIVGPRTATHIRGWRKSASRGLHGPPRRPCPAYLPRGRSKDRSPIGEATFGPNNSAHGPFSIWSNQLGDSDLRVLTRIREAEGDPAKWSGYALPIEVPLMLADGAADGFSSCTECVLAIFTCEFSGPRYSAVYRPCGRTVPVRLSFIVAAKYSMTSPA